MDEHGHHSVDFTERVERQGNLARFWLAVYNLRANGGSRNIIAFSYAGCCLYQMEMHLCRGWDQIFSIWIWLHHLTLPFNSNPSVLDWQENEWQYSICSVSLCLYIWHRVHMLRVVVRERVCIKLCCWVSALWWETTVLSAACCCWQALTLRHEENSCFTSMPGYEPCPCGSPHLLLFSSSLCIWH